MKYLELLAKYTKLDIVSIQVLCREYADHTSNSPKVSSLTCSVETRKL